MEVHFRFIARPERRAGAVAGPKYQDKSIFYGKISRQARLSLAKIRRRLQEEGEPERWPSGLRRTLGKRVCGKLYRGFESHSLRHYTVLLCSRLFESIAKTTSSAAKAVAAD